MKTAILGFAALCLFAQAPLFANEAPKADKKATTTETEHKDGKVAATCEKCHKPKAECHCAKDAEHKDHKKKG